MVNMGAHVCPDLLHTPRMYARTSHAKLRCLPLLLVCPEHYRALCPDFGGVITGIRPLCPLSGNRATMACKPPARCQLSRTKVVGGGRSSRISNKSLDPDIRKSNVDLLYSNATRPTIILHASGVGAGLDQFASLVWVGGKGGKPFLVATWKSMRKGRERRERRRTSYSA